MFRGTISLVTVLAIFGQALTMPISVPQQLVTGKLADEMKDVLKHQKELLEQMKEMGAELKDDLLTRIDDAIEQIKTNGKIALQEFVDLVNDALEALKTPLQSSGKRSDDDNDNDEEIDVKELIVLWVESQGVAIKHGRGLTSVAKSMLETLTKCLEVAMEAVKNGATHLVGLVKSLSDAIQTIIETGTIAWEEFEKLLDNFKDAFDHRYKRRNVKDSVSKMMYEILENFLESLTRLVEQGVHEAQELVATVKNAMTELMEQRQLSMERFNAIIAAVKEVSSSFNRGKRQGCESCGY